MAKVSVPSPSEAQIQASIIDWLALELRPDAVAFHVPNRWSRGGVRTGAQLKKMGLVAGIPDILILGPEGRAYAIECKAEKGTLSGPQKAMRDRLRECRVPWAVVRSLEEAQAFCHGWGLTKAERRKAA